MSNPSNKTIASHLNLESLFRISPNSSPQTHTCSMASNGKYGSNPYAPSAPSLPESYGQQQEPQYYSATFSHPPPASSYHGQQYSQYGSGFGQGSSYSYGQPGFPPGTDPAVISSFQMVDKDRSGFIDENELQQALSSGYQRFSLRTIRLLMFLFKNPSGSLRVGEFFYFIKSPFF